MGKLGKIFGKWPLWKQTAAIIAVVITLVIYILISNNYLYNKNSVITNETSATEEILGLEMDQISSYIKELTAFSIQPCYDSKFTRIIESNSTLSDDDIDYVKNQMRAYYYTRSDLNSYEIYFMKHNLIVGRKSGTQHILSSALKSVAGIDSYYFGLCSSSKYNFAIAPSDSEDDFFTFYHSIIQIDDRSSLAYVKCNIDKDFLNSLVRNRSFDEGEILVIENSDGKILYSNSTDLVTGEAEIQPVQTKQYKETVVDGRKYIYTEDSDSESGLKLISLKPESVITEEVQKVLNRCLFEGFVLWAISVAIVYWLCRLIMSPLNSLSKQLKKVGKGDLDTKIDIHGSREIEELGESFNYMSEHIQKLINENYVVKINEQTARLIALEAQINPHFLYNTLQAISTEALINDQEQIHEMVVSLAAILRYSIKGGDMVTLAEECKHVKEYFYLQKIRMNDKLSFDFAVTDEANLCLIPKISIQTLVENSIVHGLGGDTTSIRISVEAATENGLLCIKVSDNGCGMDEETLKVLTGSFDSEVLTSEGTQGVGLKNLHDRLIILYGKESLMNINSAPGMGTEIEIKIPMRRGNIE